MNAVAAMRAATIACLALAALLAAGGGLAWIAQRPAFDFRAIEVRGELRHVSAAGLRAAIAGQLAGNFFTLDLGRARRAFETVPWVARAVVRRRWPDRLEVSLLEHRAVGVWSDGRLLSDAGVLFPANRGEAEVWAPLVEFSGPPAFAGEAAARLVDFDAQFAPLGQRVVRVEVSERASWSLRTSSGSRFVLGRDEPAGRLNERLAAALAAYPTVVAQLGGPPARVDLRYPNGFVAAAAASTDARP